MNERRGFFAWLIAGFVGLFAWRSAEAKRDTKIGVIPNGPLAGLDLHSDAPPMNGTLPFVSSVHYEPTTMELIITYGGILVRDGRIAGAVFDIDPPAPTPEAAKLCLNEQEVHQRQMSILAHQQYLSIRASEARAANGL